MALSRLKRLHDCVSESNFVLELAFLQEEYESCLELLHLAESQAIHLVLPAFSVGEPYEVWVRRSKQRRELRDQLSTAIRELSRSKPYQASSHKVQELTNLLLRSGEEEKRRLDEALDRILRIAEVIPIGLSTIRSAIALQRSRSLSQQDSIVSLASILAHLAETSEDLRCFSFFKNSKDRRQQPDVSTLFRTKNLMGF